MTLPDIIKKYRSNDMKELWDEARKYGQVNLFTNSNGKYSCNITFHTIKHTELKASSGYGFDCPIGALISAIEKAEEIVKSFKENYGSL